MLNFIRKLPIMVQYKAWAPRYDRSVQEIWYSYPAPTKMARMIADVKECEAPVVIDAGIGTGLSSEALRQEFQNATIHGYDLSESMLEQACKKDIAHSYTKFDLDNPKMKWPNEDEIADIVISTGSLDHMNNIVHFIQEASRSLKPGGVLGLTHLEHSTYLKIEGSSIIREHTTKSIQDAMRQAGLEIVQYQKAEGYRKINDTGTYGYFVAMKPHAEPGISAV